MRIPFVAVLFAACLASPVQAGCKPTPAGSSPDAGPSREGRRAASGVAEASTGDGLPGDFPKQIPIYAGARIAFSAQSTAHGKTAWTVTLETLDPRDKVVDFYKRALGDLTLATCMDMGDTSMCVWQGTEIDATLMVSSEPDRKTSATLTATAK